MLITAPGLTIAPASSEVEKLTTSVSDSSLRSIAFPSLLACPLDVQAKALISFLTIPNFACLSISSCNALEPETSSPTTS